MSWINSSRDQKIRLNGKAFIDKADICTKGLAAKELIKETNYQRETKGGTVPCTRFTKEHMNTKRCSSAVVPCNKYPKGKVGEQYYAADQHLLESSMETHPKLEKHTECVAGVRTNN